MQIFDQLQDQVLGAARRVGSSIQSRVLGRNNETLDFVMDSFYKLSPQQRFSALVAGSAFVLLVFFGTLLIYFSQISKLDQNLNNSFNALHELRALKTEINHEQAKYDQLISMIENRSRSLRIKPFFEEQALATSVTIQGLSDQVVPIEAGNPLGSRLQYVSVDLRLPKISIPRLLSFLVKIEKSNNFLAVEDLQIRGRYGTKLYFDAQAKFRGYVVEGL